MSGGQLAADLVAKPLRVGNAVPAPPGATYGRHEATLLPGGRHDVAESQRRVFEEVRARERQRASKEASAMAHRQYLEAWRSTPAGGQRGAADPMGMFDSGSLVAASRRRVVESREERERASRVRAIMGRPGADVAARLERARAREGGGGAGKEAGGVRWGDGGGASYQGLEASSGAGAGAGVAASSSSGMVADGSWRDGNAGTFAGSALAAAAALRRPDAPRLTPEVDRRAPPLPPSSSAPGTMDGATLLREAVSRAADAFAQD